MSEGTELGGAQAEPSKEIPKSEDLDGSGKPVAGLTAQKGEG